MTHSSIGVRPSAAGEALSHLRVRMSVRVRVRGGVGGGAGLGVGLGLRVAGHLALVALS